MRCRTGAGSFDVALTGAVSVEAVQTGVMRPGAGRPEVVPLAVNVGVRLVSPYKGTAAPVVGGLPKGPWRDDPPPRLWKR